MSTKAGPTPHPIAPLTKRTLVTESSTLSECVCQSVRQHVSRPTATSSGDYVGHRVSKKAGPTPYPIAPLPKKTLVTESNSTSENVCQSVSQPTATSTDDLVRHGASKLARNPPHEEAPPTRLTLEAESSSTREYVGQTVSQSLATSSDEFVRRSVARKPTPPPTTTRRHPTTRPLVTGSNPTSEHVSQLVKKPKAATSDDSVRTGVSNEPNTPPRPPNQQPSKPSTPSTTGIVSHLSLVNLGKKTSTCKKSWQELNRTSENTLKMTRVEDFGLARTSRTSKTQAKKTCQKNKINGMKEEAARMIYTEERNERTKKTSTPLKVKIGTNQRRDLSSPKPKCLKRLQPAARGPSPARASIHSPKQGISKTGKERTKTLISKWEQLAHFNLTSAVSTKPKLRDFVDSQPGDL